MQKKNAIYTDVSPAKMIWSILGQWWRKRVTTRTYGDHGGKRTDAGENARVGSEGHLLHLSQLSASTGSEFGHE